jgi:hypothetical protein
MIRDRDPVPNVRIRSHGYTTSANGVSRGRQKCVIIGLKKKKRKKARGQEKQYRGIEREIFLGK